MQVAVVVYSFSILRILLLCSFFLLLHNMHILEEKDPAFAREVKKNYGWKLNRSLEIK